MRATIENIVSMGPEGALTGPIARGDVDTVRRHLESLAAGDVSAEIEQLYRTAGVQTVALAVEKGTIDEKAAQRLIYLLNQAPKER
jgi:predicted short-subunit dehydrogenase-like oxidoreductase (DUF2520 family)